MTAEPELLAGASELDGAAVGAAAVAVCVTVAVGAALAVAEALGLGNGVAVLLGSAAVAVRLGEKLEIGPLPLAHPVARDPLIRIAARRKELPVKRRMPDPFARCLVLER